MTKIVIPDAAFGGHQAMTDWDKLMDPARKALEALIAKGDEMADRIEALTEQLAAARRDAEIAEEELELQEEEACMMEDSYLELKKERDALDAKLTKAVEVAEKSIKWLRLYGADVHREAATLAELTGGKDD